MEDDRAKIVDTFRQKFFPSDAPPKIKMINGHICRRFCRKDSPDGWYKFAGGDLFDYANRTLMEMILLIGPNFDPSEESLDQARIDIAEMTLQSQ